MGLMFLQEIQKQVFFFRGQPEFHRGDLQLVTCSQVNCRLSRPTCNSAVMPSCSPNLRVTPPSSSRVSVSSGGWSTPSGVHTKAAEKGQALAAEVRAPVTSAAKAKFGGTLKCTAEAVLHPDTTTQNLLLWAQLGVFVEVRLGCTCRSACIAPLQSRHAPPEPGQPMLCRDRSVLRGVASYCRGVRHFAVADSGCARNGRPSRRRRSRRCPIGTRPRGLPSRCGRTSRGASRLQHQTLHPASALAYSCNSYFTNVAMRLTPAQLRDSFVRSGFSSRTGLSPDEVAGNVALSHSSEELQLQAIGEWGISVTPLELLHGYRDL